MIQVSINDIKYKGKKYQISMKYSFGDCWSPGHWIPSKRGFQDSGFFRAAGIPGHIEI